MSYKIILSSILVIAAALAIGAHAYISFVPATVTITPPVTAVTTTSDTANSVQPSSNPAPVNTASSATHVSISYQPPAGLTVVRHENDPGYSFVGYYTPAKTTGGTQYALFAVTVNSANPGDTPQSKAEVFKNDIGFTEQPVTISGIQGYKIESKGQFANTPEHETGLFFIKDGEEYMIMADYLDGVGDQYAPAIQAALSSVAFK